MNPICKRALVISASVAALGLLPGTAFAAKTASPSALSFPATEIDKESATQTVTVGIAATDLSGRTTTPYVATAGGQACSPSGFCNFKIVANTCPVSPAAFPAGSQTCTISVSFTPYDPTDLGVETGSLVVGNDFPDVALSGTSVAAPRPTPGGKKGKKCKKGKGKKSASAAKKKCGKKKGK